MFYYFANVLVEYSTVFNVFRYITVRAALAAVTAMLLSICLGPKVIRKLYEMKIGQEIRKDECLPLYALHKNKKGTPTMGGILIVVSVFVSMILWGDLCNKQIFISMFVYLWLAGVGFIDDYIKIKKKRSLGLTSKQKLLGQLVLAGLVILFVSTDPQMSTYFTELSIPFFKNIILDFKYLYFAFFVIVLVGSSNAVNLTDGIDGLAIGCVIISVFAYGIISYIVGNAIFSKYLHIFHVAGSGELTVLCGALVGGGMGFLWYNSYPAQVFMGDTGSLSLGGVLGMIAVLCKQELILVIIGGIFVLEALSVIIQVVSFKTRKKRIFLMSPIHHHFEIKGWAEMKVTIRFWIIAVVFALMGLGSLKLR